MRAHQIDSVIYLIIRTNWTGRMSARQHIAYLSLWSSIIGTRPRKGPADNAVGLWSDNKQGCKVQVLSRDDPYSPQDFL